MLEIGAGRGANFGQISSGVERIGPKPSAGSRAVLAGNARHHGHRTPPLAATAEAIPLPDAGVDAVLATTVLCSVRDQTRVLDEVARVLMPAGRVVLAEHVAAPEGSAVRRLQRIARPLTRLFDHGCDPARDTESGAAQRASHRAPFLVIHATKPDDTQPGKTGSSR